MNYFVLLALQNMFPICCKKDQAHSKTADALPQVFYPSSNIKMNRRYGVKNLHRIVNLAVIPSTLSLKRNAPFIVAFFFVVFLATCSKFS